MKLVSLMQKPDFPGLLMFQPAGLVSLPSSVDVTDRWSNNGSGIGTGSNSIKTALGEYFERRHFYGEVISRTAGTLNHSLTVPEVRGFTKAFSQTASEKVTLQKIKDHRFNLSPVIRTSDFSSCYIPTVCISLSSNRLGGDNVFYPLRDTCGCSFHWDPENAFLGAIKEHLERQFLLRFWLTKECHTSLGFEQSKRVLRHRKTICLYEVLARSGEVSVFDISDDDFPGACMLIVYGQSDSTHHVRYCAGMSYASDIHVALEKAILELWQTFRFMNLFKSLGSDESKVKDPYLRHFLSCNSYETYQEIKKVRLVTRKRHSSQAEFNLSGLLSVLKSKNIIGYIYSNVFTLNDFFCIASKYVSPDLFMHMNNSRNINLNNEYSKNFEGSVINHRAKNMVPFP